MQVAPVPASRDRYLWALTLLGALLLLYRLDARCLWQDEAETALLGRSILTHGVPVAFDGTNLVSQEVGREFDGDYVWRWSPWAQFYTAAAGLKLFGDGTAGARLPFAIIGIVAIPVVYAAARAATASVLAARFATFFLVTSPWFLLHARQARWYPLAYLLAAFALLAVYRIRDTGRSSWVAALALSGAALFYTNYFVAICYLVALAAATPLLRPDRAAFARFAAGFGTAALLSVPGVVFHRVASRGESSTERDVLAQALNYAEDFSALLVPLAVALMVLWIAVREKRPAARYLLAVSVAMVLLLSIAPWMMFRYLTVLFPVAATMLGLAAASAFQWNRVAGLVLAGVLAGTTLLHDIPFGSAIGDERFAGSPLRGYLQELANPPADVICTMTEVLQRQALPGETVVTTYGDLTFQFYTKLRVRGGLSGQTLPPDPEWIVIRAMLHSEEPGKDVSVLRWLQQNIDGRAYRVIAEPPDVMLASNPDPGWHRFQQTSDAPPARLLVRKDRPRTARETASR